MRCPQEQEVRGLPTVIQRRQRARWRGHTVRSWLLHQAHVDDDDREGLQARASVLRRLLVSLRRPDRNEHEPVGLVVLEEHRLTRVSNFDRSVRAELVRSGDLDDAARTLAVSPGVEHLLWLPDVLCSAYRQALRGRPDLFDEVAGVTYVARLRSVEPMGTSCSSVRSKDRCSYLRE